MGYSGRRFNIANLPNQGIAVTQCGLTICDAGHEVKTRIYGHYSAHFIVAGKGTFVAGNKTYELHAGQGFMITPDLPNSYVADETEPWRYIYANFSGADDEAIAHYAGFSDDNVIFDYEMTDDMMHDLFAMHKCAERPNGKGYDVTGYFLLVMSRLIAARSMVKEVPVLPEHYVGRAISFIEDNYPYNISVQDIAEFVGIDRTYLYRIFLKRAGTSPGKYLLNYRLSRAEALMSHPKLSLNDISMATGFFDAAHFSKSFAAKYGVPPGQYRRNKYSKKP